MSKGQRGPDMTTNATRKASDSAKPGSTLPMLRPDQADIDTVRFPDLSDLLSRLHFSTSDGRIWLDEHRMLLVHAKALGSLRREMIETLGVGRGAPPVHSHGLPGRRL